MCSGENLIPDCWPIVGITGSIQSRNRCCWSEAILPHFVLSWFSFSFSFFLLLPRWRRSLARGVVEREERISLASQESKSPDRESQSGESFTGPEKTCFRDKWAMCVYYFNNHHYARNSKKWISHAHIRDIYNYYLCIWSMTVKIITIIEFDYSFYCILRILKVIVEKQRS